MNGGEDLRSQFGFDERSAIPGDPEGGPEKSLRRGRTEADDHLRTDHSDLGLQPWSTGGDLDRIGLLVDAPLPPGLPIEMLHHVGHIGLVPVDAGLQQATVEQTASRTDEGLSAEVFLVARLFTDEHHSRCAATGTEHGSGCPFPQVTCSTSLCRLTQTWEGRIFGHRGCLRVCHRRQEESMGRASAAEPREQINRRARTLGIEFIRQRSGGSMKFQDRSEAGRELAGRLSSWADNPEVVVLALPRGGVPVAAEVAIALHAPLDVFLVRKLGMPGHEELAMGAIASGGTRVLNYHVVQTFDIPQATIDEVTLREQKELQRRESAYRGDRQAVPIRDRTIILVDDGLATGATMRAAVSAVRDHQPAAVIVAVPVASPDTCRDLSPETDGIVCIHTPTDFQAVGQFYEDFSQTSDEEVRSLLAAAAARG